MRRVAWDEGESDNLAALESKAAARFYGRRDEVKSERPLCQGFRGKRQAEILASKVFLDQAITRNSIPRQPI